MMSERTFAKLSSLWNSVLPSSEQYIRYINRHRQRFSAPINPISPAEHNGYVNELAFRLARQHWPESSRDFSFSNRHLKRVLKEIGEWLGQGQVVDSLSAPDERAIFHDARALALRLLNFVDKFAPTQQKVEFSPWFNGCGVVAGCAGDIVVGSTLVEVKSGSRSFRVTDLRQVLIYCALGESRPETETVMLLNPRMGLFWRDSLEEVARGCGALTATDLLYSLRAELSAEAVSR